MHFDDTQGHIHGLPPLVPSHLNNAGTPPELDGVIQSMFAPQEGDNPIP
jgi:hypothetical protein